MEFLRAHKRRSVLSETIYVLLNLGLAISVLVVTWATGTPWLALILVLLSKWRVLAVRPRYWFAHVESNIVDMIVGISVVILIYLAGQASANGVAVQVGITALYIAWLLYLKPRGSRRSVAVQAAVALVVGTIALASVSYEWPSSLFVLLVWIIGYSTARHLLVAYSDSDTRLLSFIWAFVAAELAWITYHWTIAYSIPFAEGLQLPQITLLLLGLSFIAERAYSSYDKHGEVRLNEIGLPMSLAFGVIIVLLLFFNAAPVGVN